MTLPFRQNPQMKQNMSKIIKEKLEQGIIEPCESGEWSSPAFLISKRETNSFRLVVDYRKLNAYTILNNL